MRVRATVKSFKSAHARASLEIRTAVNGYALGDGQRFFILALSISSTNSFAEAKRTRLPHPFYPQKIAHNLVGASFLRCKTDEIFYRQSRRACDNVQSQPSRFQAVCRFDKAYFEARKLSSRDEAHRRHRFRQSLRPVVPWAFSLGRTRRTSRLAPFVFRSDIYPRRARKEFARPWA